MGIAVVTGASAGLGVEFARQLQHDPEVDEIWLVARRRERLEELAGELTAVKAVVVPCDLADAAQVSSLATRFAEAGDRLHVLINNAGFAISGPFAEQDAAGLLAMVDVNIRAVVQLTRAALDHMTEGARILQVSSSAAFYPMPGFSTYAAAKTFVFYWTMALAAELARKQIKATVLCPGPVVTEFWDVATDGAKAAPPIVSQKPARVVRTALRNLRGWSWTSMPGILWRLSAWFSRWCPWRITAVVVRTFNPY